LGSRDGPQRLTVMKVFNLRCNQTHQFEGWFASLSDFDDQSARGMIRCPQCDSVQVLRVPAASRISVPSKDEAVKTLVTGKPDWLEALRTLILATEDVGERFPEEARRIHYAEVPSRAIRGTATPAERHELEDEGIDVVALPLEAVRKEPLQ
jgi:hypothetical protein